MHFASSQGTSINIMMKPLLLHFSALLCIASSVSARQWTTLVDPNILVVTDKGMVKILVEDNPHHTRTTFRPTGSPTISPVPTQYPTLPLPTKKPTVSPTFTASPSTTFGPSGTFGPTFTFSPSTSMVPTWTPGTGPTGSPSGRYENIEGNGGCVENEVLYEVIMKDKWGDGWDGRNLTIRRLGDEFANDATPVDKPGMTSKTSTYTDSAGNSYTVTKFVEDVSANDTGSAWSDELPPNPVYDTTLTTGLTVGFAYVCLRPTRCYQAEIPRGLWSEEIEWEVRRVSMGGEALESPLPLAGGGAPTNCTFYVPTDDTDFGDASTCPATCSIFLRNAFTEAPKPDAGIAVTTQTVAPKPTLGSFLAGMAAAQKAPTSAPTINSSEEGKVATSLNSFLAEMSAAHKAPTSAPTIDSTVVGKATVGLSSFLAEMSAAHKAPTSAPTIDSTVVGTAATSIAAETFAGRNAPVTASPLSLISATAAPYLALSTVVSKSPTASTELPDVAPAASPTSTAASPTSPTMSAASPASPTSPTAANPAASPVMTNADTDEMMTSGAMADPTENPTPGPTSVPTTNTALMRVSGGLNDKTPKPVDPPTDAPTAGPTNTDPPTDAPTEGPTSSSTMNFAVLMALGANAAKTTKTTDHPTKAPTHKRNSAPDVEETSTVGMPWDSSFLSLAANPPDVETFTGASVGSGTSWNQSSGKATTSEKDDGRY